MGNRGVPAAMILTDTAQVSKCTEEPRGLAGLLTPLLHPKGDVRAPPM